MPRITTVVKSQKPQGNCYSCGKPIEKGEGYKWFAIKTGPTSSTRKNFHSACTIKPSMMTGSDKLSRLYEARESVEATLSDDSREWVLFRDSVAEALQNASNEAREVGEEYQSSFDNMPEGFQQGSKGQEIEEKAEACGQWADALENAAGEVEGIEISFDDPREEGSEEVGTCDLCGHETAWMGSDVTCDTDELPEGSEPCTGKYQLKTPKLTEEQLLEKESAIEAVKQEITDLAESAIGELEL